MRLPLRQRDRRPRRPRARPEQRHRDGRFGRQATLAGRCVVGADDPPGLLGAVLVAHDDRRAEARPLRPAPAASSTTTTACAIFSRSRAIFVSRCAWSFLASWYSLFSFRSPHSRAVLIRSAISRRPSPSSAASSAFERLEALGRGQVARLASSAPSLLLPPRTPSLARPRRRLELEVGARRARTAARRSARSRPARAAAPRRASRRRTGCR